MGESGTTYTASSLLGELELLGRSPAPFVRVASSPSGLLGVSEEARLFGSYDFGGVWAETLNGNTVVDVGLLPNGNGLALLSPERLLTTQDFGRTWRPLDAEPVGCHAHHRWRRSFGVVDAPEPLRVVSGQALGGGGTRRDDERG